MAIVILTIELGTAALVVREPLNIDNEPPGIGIPAMALLDAQLVFATILYGLGVILPDPAIGLCRGSPR